MSGGIKVSNKDNPIVFFDVSVGGKEIGRLKMEVYIFSTLFYYFLKLFTKLIKILI